MRIKYEAKSSIDNSVEFSKLKSGDIIQTWWNNEREYIIKIENEEIFIGGFRKINSNDKWQRYNNNNKKIDITIIKRVFENPFQQGNYAIYINTNRIVRIESKIVMTSTGLFRTRCSWYPNLNQYGYVVDLDKLMSIEWDFELLKAGNFIKLKEDDNTYKIETISFECGTVQLKQIGQNTCASFGANHVIVPMSKIEYTFPDFKFKAVIIPVDAKTKFLPSELKRFIMDNLEVGDFITREGNEQFKYRVATIDFQTRSIGLDQAVRIKPPSEIHEYKTLFHIYFESLLEIQKVNPFFQQKLYFKMDKVKKDLFDQGWKPVLAGPVKTQVEIEYKELDPKYVYQDMYWPWTKVELPKYGSSLLDLFIVDYCNRIPIAPLKTNLDSKDFLDYLNDLIKELDITKGELVDMKNFEKENMQAGKADAIAKKKEYERVESEKRYTILLNQLDSVNAQIKALEEQKKQIETEMAKFD